MSPRTLFLVSYSVQSIRTCTIMNFCENSNMGHLLSSSLHSKKGFQVDPHPLLLMSTLVQPFFEFLKLCIDEKFMHDQLL